MRIDTTVKVFWLFTGKIKILEAINLYNLIINASIITKVYREVDQASDLAICCSL